MIQFAVNTGTATIITENQTVSAPVGDVVVEVSNVAPPSLVVSVSGEVVAQDLLSAVVGVTNTSPADFLAALKALGFFPASGEVPLDLQALPDPLALVFRLVALPGSLSARLMVQTTIRSGLTGAIFSSKYTISTQEGQLLPTSTNSLVQLIGVETPDAERAAF